MISSNHYIMNNLKCRKQKLNGLFECKKTNKLINIKECNNCIYKEYKDKTKCTINQKYCAKIKNRTYKQTKKEKNRKSILTNDLNHCIICGAKKDHLHEVFSGAYRTHSINENMVLPLCVFHHTQIHKDIELSLFWKRLCQQKFEESRTRDEFIKIFGRSYL